VKELVFCLEELSARVLLEGLLARLPLGGVQTKFIVFEGKQDLDKHLAKKLRGYLNPHATFIVLRDQDRNDCRTLKLALQTKCQEAGRADALVRIACREIESFYLGDLAAAEAAFSIHNLAKLQNRARYRDPDQIERPSKELEKVTKRRYQKVAGSRAIAPHLSFDNTRSRSFENLIGAIRVQLDRLQGR